MKAHRQHFGHAFQRARTLHRAFREAEPKRLLRQSIRVPKVLMSLGTCEYIGYRTTHGELRETKLYRHTFASGSRPTLAAGPGPNELFLIGGRYHVTDRGIVDLDIHGVEIDEPEHDVPLDNED